MEKCIHSANNASAGSHPTNAVFVLYALSRFTFTTIANIARDHCVLGTSIVPAPSTAPSIHPSNHSIHVFQRNYRLWTGDVCDANAERMKCTISLTRRTFERKCAVARRVYWHMREPKMRCWLARKKNYEINDNGDDARSFIDRHK